MPRLEASVTTTTTRRVRVEVTAADIREWLRRDERFVDLPDDAEVIVPVPGGGDWSHMDLDIGHDAPLVVRWTTTEDSE